ncbi:hypothetical protein [Streptomyces sp. G-G2]|uniref:hypothetical protein n=1 Tax=Streptomyces sp. G-G2 TaxID=3046201 RepID=UPI0024B8B46C|nr:hypothetical protein [Streptomyces sp. G-G2]MDJ0380143.1 hypothetical protein [Streptomyces sp. G-G2]
MYGNPLYRALALAAATVLLVPLAVGMLAGWTALRLTARAAVRLYAWALLCVYALAPLNAVSRMANASPAVVSACSLAGLAFVAATTVLIVRAAGVARRASEAKGW